MTKVTSVENGIYIQEKPNHSTPSKSGVLLELSGFGVSIGHNVVLDDISFTVPERGIVVLAGPKDSDKSLLLHTLTGKNSASSLQKTWGEAHYRGSVLANNERPALVVQNAQLIMSSVLDNVLDKVPGRLKLSRLEQRELAQHLLHSAGLDDLCDRLDELKVNLPLALQRHLSIFHGIASNPPLICLDDPTKGLSALEISRLFAYIRQESKHRALMVVLYNPQHVKLLGGYAVLIVNGKLYEKQPILDMFDKPHSAVASEFCRTGKCSVATLLGAYEENSVESIQLKQSELVVDHASSVSDVGGINHQAEIGKFLWLKRGSLAGTPAPGILSNISDDLKALQLAGVTTIVTLTENKLDASKVKEFGLKNIWEPIPKMGAPSYVQAVNICKHIESLHDQGEVVAIQGHTGLGRTGTVLAAHLLWEGMKLDNALEYVRRVEPRWVQSQSQVEFLQEFSQRV